MNYITFYKKKISLIVYTSNTDHPNLFYFISSIIWAHPKPDKKYLIFSSEIIPESLIALTKFAFTCTLNPSSPYISLLDNQRSLG